MVEEPQNVNVIEKSRGFRGMYHVLMGTISPLQGVGPDDLKIKALLDRLDGGRVDEVILATSPTVEGEATAIYLARLLQVPRRAGHADCHGHPGGQRLGVRRRAHDGQGHGGPPRRLLASSGRDRIIVAFREMLPISYQLPAAVVLILCGLMACVAGYRLLWWVLAAFGFIIGGLAASSILGTSDTAYMAGRSWPAAWPAR